MLGSYDTFFGLVTYCILYESSWRCTAFYNTEKSTIFILFFCLTQFRAAQKLFCQCECGW